MAKITIEDDTKNINCENTVTISDEGIKVKPNTSIQSCEQTDLDPSEKELLETDYQLFRMSELEKKQYLETVKRENENKYKFQGKLVSGGMGAILKVMDQDLQRPTAMKVVLPSLKNDKDAINEFIKEAIITGLLEHPSIIPVHELGLSNETGLFFTMKLIQGEPLNRILSNIKKGIPEYVEKYNMFYLLSIFRRICDAIAFAHSKDIIHQDIKPHNVIVGQYGEVLVMDWGLARYIGDPEKEEDPVRRRVLKYISVSSYREKKVIQGSPAYMSPEQVKGDNLLQDKQTDIFLLSTTLYHILTLEAPYIGDNIVDVLNKAEHRELIPPQTRNPDRLIPEELCRIIMKAAALKKEDRYQSVQDLIVDLDDIIAGRWSKQGRKSFACGQLLMREGESGQEAYLITKGKVQVFKQTGGNKVVLNTLQNGDIVGEMAIITGEKRSANVAALEDTEVAVFTKQLIAQNLKKMPPYIEKMVSTITHRLQAANELIHPHLTTDCTPFVLQQLYLILKTKSGTRKTFIIPFDEICLKISEDLGIPISKVKKVFLNAAERDLLSIKKTYLHIKDINKIIHSASLMKSLINNE